MCAGYKPDCFVTSPKWYLNDVVMDTVTKLDILGVTFNNNFKTYEHVQNRVQKCRRAFYSLNNVGMYGGFADRRADWRVDMHIWRIYVYIDHICTIYVCIVV